jgi:hypothetical protein
MSSKVEAKGTASTSHSPSPFLQLVAGQSQTRGSADGSLLDSRFASPIHVTVWRDALFVSDHLTHTIRLIDGVVGVPAGQLSALASTAQADGSFSVVDAPVTRPVSYRS